MTMETSGRKPLSEQIAEAIAQKYPSAPAFVRFSLWFLFMPAFVGTLYPPEDRRSPLSYVIFYLGVSLMVSAYLLILLSSSIGLLQGADILPQDGVIGSLRLALFLIGLSITLILMTVLWLLCRGDPWYRQRFRDGAWEVWSLFIWVLFFLRP